MDYCNEKRSTCNLDSQKINSLEELLSSCDKVAILFTAKWCGPCKKIHPLFEELQCKYENIKFVEIDVDDKAYYKLSQHVDCIPYVKLYSKGKVIDNIEGYDPDELKSAVRKLSEKSKFKVVALT